MKRSTDRILTSHVGSLIRPPELIEFLRAQQERRPVDDAAFAKCLTNAVVDIVRRQAEVGIDVVDDGEFGKTISWSQYALERLSGFERRPISGGVNPFARGADRTRFAAFYAELDARDAPATQWEAACIGEIAYTGQAALKRDIDNLRAAAKAAGVPEQHVFLPATAPSGVGINEYYKTQEEYFFALAAELAKEYRAIHAAGMLVQIDDPFLPDIFFEPGLDDAQKKRRASIYVEATNTALKGIPAESVRFHTCYGINEGPRLYEAGLADIIQYVLQIDAGSYSFEAANPRHEHEYHLFERVKVPDGKVLVPGVITHASNIVEHPELIAERLVRFAKLVGRENVIAGADCGFSSQALYKTEVHPTVVWEKFKAMRQGADLATRQLWK